MKSLRLVSICVALFAMAVFAKENKTIPGVGPAGEVVKLHSDFKFTEGPAHDADGNVYFTDIPNNKILKSDTEGKLTTFLEDTKGCNGLMFNSKGKLIACQGGTGKIIDIDPKTKDVTDLAEVKGSRPNDLVIDRDDGVYFTDPGNGKVYYISSAGKVSTAVENLSRPNGVLLSPDEKTLIVLPSGMPFELQAFPITEPGKVGEKKVLCKLKGGGDGLTVDTKGNYYVTQPRANSIAVISPEGKNLGALKFAEGPANVVFGGKDRKTLYVTAQTSLYTVKMDATGHRFASGK